MIGKHPKVPALNNWYNYEEKGRYSTLFLAQTSTIPEPNNNHNYRKDCIYHYLPAPNGQQLIP